MSRKRAALAGLLSIVYPGLGHVYLRAWIRALGWFGLALATASLVVPDQTVQSIDTLDLGVILDAARTLPRDALLAILFVRVLNVVDAAWLGLTAGRLQEGEGPPTCPECGGELDEEIDFCPWCTQRLETTETAESTETAATSESRDDAY